MASVILTEIIKKVHSGIPISHSEAVYLVHEIKRLQEALNEAKSEAFQAQRELWRVQK